MQGRLYRQNSAAGIELTASTSTRLVPASLTGNGSSVLVTFTNQLAIPFPIGTTISLDGVGSYSGTFSITTASITGSTATIGWSASTTASATLTSSTVKFNPENKIILSSVASLTGGMSIVGTGISSSVTIQSINTSSNLLVLSSNNLDTILAGQYLYLNRNSIVNTNTVLDCLNVFKRKVISSGLTGDPTKDSILQMQNTFEEAIAQSPNSEEVKIVEDTLQQIKLVLISESKTGWSDDEKLLAAPLGQGFTPGKTVDWIRTDFKYLIMDQSLTQKAYFSGKIKQCTFLLKWLEYSQWAVVTGPDEKESNFITKQGISIDPGEDGIQIFLGKSAGTPFLIRYNRIILNNRSWKIVGINDLDSQFIVKINLLEDYINVAIDDTTNSIANNQDANIGVFQTLVLGDLT
jgi:hypothetical protein